MESITRHTTSRLANLAVITLVFGSLWGLSEVVLGGGLRSTDFPYRSGLLTAMGMALLAMAFVFSRKPLLLVGVGVVAALVTQLSVPILHTSITCKANSSLALVVEAASLGLVAAVLLGKPGRGVFTRMGGGALAAIIAATGFYFMGTHAVPCNYLLSFTTPQSFVVKEGLVWAAFTAFLLPLGWAAAEKMAASSLPTLSAHRFAYYGGVAGVIALSLGASALAIVAGF